MRYAASLLRLCTVLALVFPALSGQVAAAPPGQVMSSPLMVYHELTLRPEGSRGIDAPIISGDGRRVIWAESPGDPSPREENRVFALDLEGGQPVEIDAYQPICACRARVDVSDDGNTVVSTEGVRIRILSGVATLGQAREVLRLANNAIGALRISGDGKLVVFVVIRDTTVSEPNPLKRGVPIPRGIWAFDADGGAPMHLAGVKEIAAASGVPESALEADPEFTTADAVNALDISDDGGRIIFGAHVGNGREAVYSLTKDAPLNQLYGPVQSVGQTAVSGDGQTVAFMAETQVNARVSVMSGETLRLAPVDSMFRDERLQLSRDGSTLLGKGLNGAVLVDVATSAMRQLFSTIPLSTLAAGASSRLLNGPGGSPTMNAAGTRVLYVADPLASNHGNLAVIELGATALNGAPLIRELHADPDTIPRDGSTGASLTADVSWDDSLIGVWLEILRDGVPETVFGPSVVTMERDVGHDPRALQGVFAATLQSRDMGHSPGPRQLRVLSESQAEDGRRQGTVFDSDTMLTIGDPATSGRVYRGNASGLTIDIGSGTTPGQLVIGSVAAEIILEPSIGGNFKVVGRSLSYEAERVSEAGCQKESFKASAGDGDLYGAWGLIRFEGEITTQSDQNGLQTLENWTVDVRLVRDSNGYLVVCPYNRDLGLDEQAANAHCLTTAMVVLQPVVDEPPQPSA
jgi:hypothetical protein